MTTAIDCPECGHDIDMHDMADGCDHDENVSADAWVPCPCGLAPSGVAEAMLSGPPNGCRNRCRRRCHLAGS